MTQFHIYDTIQSNQIRSYIYSPVKIIITYMKTLIETKNEKEIRN